MRDVAVEAGVSNSVVSMVLNGGGGKTVRVSAATRQRVMDTAARLGYRRHSQATAMRHGRLGTLALVLPLSGHSAYLPAQFVHELSVVVGEHDMHLVVASMSDEQLTSPGYVPKILRELAADGLLINYVANIPAPIMALINEHAIPSIWLNRKAAADCANPADLESAREATEHLLGLGHERVTFVYCGVGGHYSVADRQAGYEQAMHDRGLTPRVVAQAYAPYSMLQRAAPDPRLHVIRGLLSRTDRPTAIVTYSQGEALVVQRVAAEMGLRVPEDLSLVGFHDDMIESGGLPVTTWVHDTTALARAAVQMLIQKIAAPAERVPPRAVPFLRLEGLSCKRMAARVGPHFT